MSCRIRRSLDIWEERLVNLFNVLKLKLLKQRLHRMILVSESSKFNLSRSGSTHARSQRVFPEVVVREGFFGQASTRLVGDNHIFHKGCPAHVGVPQRFGHEPLVWFNGLEPVAHVPAGPNYQFCKVATMGHHKNIRLQADQEVKGCQAGHVLPEAIQLLLACQLLLRRLSQTLKMIIPTKSVYRFELR